MVGSFATLAFFRCGAHLALILCMRCVRSDEERMLYYIFVLVRWKRSKCVVLATMEQLQLNACNISLLAPFLFFHLFACTCLRFIFLFVAPCWILMFLLVFSLPSLFMYEYFFLCILCGCFGCLSLLVTLLSFEQNAHGCWICSFFW